MAKEIAIGIKINSQGTDKVIRNLADLEKELTNLNTQIKTLDFGSPQFIEAQKNIQILKSSIDDFGKATEGLGGEKNFKALAASVNVLTGSLQVATGAFALFISEEEDLKKVQEAEAKALGALNLALGINAIQKELVESRTKRAAIAEQVYTIATNLSTKATQLFNTALKANPIALFTAAIIAAGIAIYGLIKAFQAFGKEQTKAEKQAKAIKAVEDSLIETRKKAGAELQRQLVILTDNVKTRNVEKKTIEDLKKTYPGFNAFVDKNNKLTKEGIDFLETKIELMKIEAIIQAVADRKATAEINLAQDNAKLESEGVSLLEQTIGLLTNRNAVLTKYVDNAKKYSNATAGLNEVEAKALKQKDQLLIKDAKYQKQLDITRKSEEDAAKAVDKNVLAILKKVSALEKYAEVLAVFNKELQSNQEAALGYTSALLNAQEETIDKQTELLKTRGDALKSEGELFLEKLNAYLFTTIPTEEDAKKLVDGYGRLFEEVRKGIISGDLNVNNAIGWKEFVEFATKSLPEISNELKNVNDESRLSFVEYFNSLDNRLEIIKEALGDTPDLLSALGQVPTEDFEKLIGLEEKIFQLQKDQIEQGFTAEELRRKELEIVGETFGLQSKIQENFKKTQQLKFNLDREADENKKKALQDEINALDNITKQYQDISATILDGVLRTNTFVKGLRDVEEQSEKNLNIIKEQKQNLDEFLDPGKLLTYFENLGDGYDFILKDLGQNLDKFLEKFGAEGVVAILEGISSGVGQVEFQTRDEVQKYITLLESVGEKISQALGLGGNPFQTLVDDLKTTLRSLPKEAEGISKFLTEAIVEGLSRKDIAERVLSAYSDISSRLTNIIQTNNATLLEQIQYQTDLSLAEQDKLLEQAGNNQKAIERIEKEKQNIALQGAKKRFEIEKKARIQELRFSQFQAVADASQAALNALANIPAPFGLVYSASIAGLTAFQVRAIEQQLNQAQSQVFIGRRGGAIMGGSHEQGGVPALLEGGEFVMNKEAVGAFGEQIQAINNSTGGRPMAIDDSRLVQAIAAQNLDKKQPLKTYVLFQDIKDTEKLNSKISQLSRL
jgi:hypothetical protein